ncbi:MAG: hypothetical protein V3U60_16185 [Gammaproteobacteria bacterium]
MLMRTKDRFWILWPWIAVLVLCVTVPLVLAHEEVLPKSATSANYLHVGDEPILGVLLTQEQVHGVSETLANYEQRIAELEETLSQMKVHQEAMDDLLIKHIDFVTELFETR